MLLPLDIPSAPGPAIDTVPLNDRRGTPDDLVCAVLALEGRHRFDLDAAAEHGMHVRCRRYLTVADDALGPLPWRRRMDTPLDDLPPLVWLNPPFSDACGGKVRWIEEAATRARDEGLRVWMLLPCASGESWFRAACEHMDAWRIVAGRRVRFRSPAGLRESSPPAMPMALWRYVPEGYGDALSGSEGMVWI